MPRHLVNSQLLWDNSTWLEQSSLLNPQVGGRFDGVNLGSGVLGIPPPKKKTSYCWMLQKSGYINTWHGAKNPTENDGISTIYQFLNWFSRQIAEPWVGKQRFLKWSGMQSSLFCCPRFVFFFSGVFLVVLLCFIKAKHNKKIYRTNRSDDGLIVVTIWGTTATMIVVFCW